MAVFTHNLFGVAVKNTLHFALILVIGTVLIGMGVALVLNERFHGRSFVRTIVIIPWAISPIVVGIVWGWIYNGTYGALNALLAELGLITDYVGWLASGSRALNLVALAYVWREVPFAALLFLAALQTIPVDLYQAARVDGAGSFSRFWFVTLPWLRPTLLVVLVVVTLEGFFAFSIIYVMTGGGPGTATSVLAWLGYIISFLFFDLGRGAAVFYFLTIILLALAFVYVRFIYGAMVKTTER